MRRRDLIFALPLTAAARSARGQQPAYRIAIVISGGAVSNVSETGILTWRAFFETLRRSGYVEGRNLLVERYSAGARTERYAELAREAVGRNPDLIVAVTSGVARACREATGTIPIVGSVVDPVAWGLAASLAHPGGNFTGASVDGGIEIEGKRLQLLKEAIPSASRVAVFGPRLEWEGPIGQQLREAAQPLGLSLLATPIQDEGEEECRRWFAATAEARPDAMIVETPAPPARLIVELAERYRLPAIYRYRYFVEAGGLMAYGPDLPDVFGHIGDYVHRILEGAKPAEMPIYQPTKFELAINLKTAKVLDLALSSALVARADLVIE